MHFSPVAAALFGLSFATSGSAFVITLFADDECKGDSRPGLNVYDSTCSTPGFRFKSFTVDVTGGAHQLATAFMGDSCAGSYNYGPVWADGGDTTGDFNQGKCVQLPSSAGAINSRPG